MERKTNKLKERFSSISITGKVIILIVLIILFIGSVVLNNALAKKRQKDYQERQQETTQEVSTEEATAKEPVTQLPAEPEELLSTAEAETSFQGGGVELTPEQQKDLEDYLKELETKQ